MAIAGVEEERGLFVQAGLGPNPTIGYVRSDATKSGESQTNGILIQQTFITANKLGLSQASERNGIRQSQWQFQAQQMRVLNDVRLRYMDVAAAQQRIEVAQELLDIAEENLRSAEQLLRAKQAARTDVLQETVERNNLRLALQNAEIEYRTAWTQLAVIAGVPDIAPHSVVAPQEPLPTFEAETEWQRLVSQSPQLRTAEAAVGVARADLARQQAQPIPDVTVQVVADYDSVGDFGTVNSLVALPLPVVDRNQGNIYQARQEVVRACREVERVRLVLRDQLAASLRDYEQARNESETLRDEILPAARENLGLVRQGYRIGEFPIASVIAAQRTYQEQRLRLVDAEARARGLGIEIAGLQLTGGLNPAEIGTAIQGGSGQRRAVQAAIEQQRNTRLNNFAPAAID